MSIYEEGDGLLAVVRSGLLAIGYMENLLREQYAFADLTTTESALQHIDLAVFAEEPVSYRSACFGITVLHDERQNLKPFLSLGAPQLLTIHPREKQIGRWIVKASDEPELIEKLSSAGFRQRLNEHGVDWSPREVLRAKAIRDPGPQQLDFYDVGLVPMLEQIFKGKPVIVGRRVTVELILEKLAAGETVEQILDAHPRLNEDAVRAALAFAAHALRADVVYPLETTPR
jgi:uncharacterized protein (DUF433 family)